MDSTETEALDDPRTSASPTAIAVAVPFDVNAALADAEAAERVAREKLAEAKRIAAEAHAGTAEHRTDSDAAVAAGDHAEAVKASRAAAASSELGASADRIVEARKGDLEVATIARKRAHFRVREAESKRSDIERQSVTEAEAQRVTSFVAESLARVTAAEQAAVNSRGALDEARFDLGLPKVELGMEQFTLVDRSVNVLAKAMPAAIRRVLSRI